MPRAQVKLIAELQGFWANDLWDMHNSPVKAMSPSARQRRLRFRCKSPALNGELKYLCWKKFSSGEWADAIFACLGPALEVYSRYARVEKANGESVALKEYLEHVRAAVAIQPTQFRSATVTATEKSVVLKLPELQLTDIARLYPDVWRFIAKELARRLEQRNAHVTATHDKIRIFIISSAEALEIARTIQNAFEYDFTVVVWTDGVFRASWYPIESLE